MIRRLRKYIAVAFAVVALGWSAAAAPPAGHAPAAATQATIAMLPLDERFTTRDAFLNLATVAGAAARVVTPPLSMLPSRKAPCDVRALDQWLVDAVSGAHNHSVTNVVISAEMFLYGGLIASRVSNDSTAAVSARAAQLTALAAAHPRVRFVLSAVVMRIPSYNEDVEEPWYWALYGADLYNYSYFSDKYAHTGDPADAAAARAAQAKVPPAVVQTFLWRRQRNYNVTVELIQALAGSLQGEGAPLFDYLYVTLDDNALYGFNIAEAARLRQLVQHLNLTQRVLIYPGADEVGLTLLARTFVTLMGRQPRLRLVFRDPAAVSLVPNYEGQPMIDTLRDQVVAAGGVPVNASADAADVQLLVNNFSEEPQLEAAQQPLTGRSIDDYAAAFDPYVCQHDGPIQPIVGFADNRYSNGGDVLLAEYMAQRARNSSCGGTPMRLFAYAGWNTDGNTLGTVISNAILLSLFGQSANATGNTYFNTLRIVEDVHYQAQLRQRLVAYVSQCPADSVSNLAQEPGPIGLPFYTEYVYKVLSARTQEVAQTYATGWSLRRAYFPWNRTFEIGLVADQGAS